MALPFLSLGVVTDIANLCWLSAPPKYDYL